MLSIKEIKTIIWNKWHEVWCNETKSIDEMEKNVDDDDLLNEEEIISMSNFNEENQDEEDIEETSPI